MFDSHEPLTVVSSALGGASYYSIFVITGILAGVFYYLNDAKRRHVQKEGVVAIVSAGLLGGFIGAKIPLLFENHELVVLLTGKSIMGGILGGMLGVWFIKKVLKIKLKLGNIIAPAVALGMSIGRLGCFFGGCCYGVVSSWGFNFGDGQLRLPTQLFELVFHALAFIILNFYKDKVTIPGVLFKTYIVAYFIFRFFLEFIRVNPIVWGGMTIYQIISVLSVGGILFVAIIKRAKNE